MNNIRFAFDFHLAGYGRYIVTYTTPTRGDYWRAYITDMTMIAAFRRLRDAVKNNGTHYRRNGEPIED